MKNKMKQFNNKFDGEQVVSEVIPEKLQSIFDSAGKMSLSHDDKTSGVHVFRNLIEGDMAKVPSIENSWFFKAKSYFIGVFWHPIMYPYLYKRRYLMAPVSALAVVLLVFGAGGVYASRNSLPGDLLYPVKIKIGENIENLVAVGLENQTKVSARHVISRLEETEVLLVNGKMDNEKESSISAYLDSESAGVRAGIFRIQERGDIDLAVNISSQFEDSLKKHENKINTLVGASTTNLPVIRKNLTENLALSTENRTEFESKLPETNPIIRSKKAAISQLASSEEKVAILNLSTSTATSSAKIRSQIDEQINIAGQNITEGREKLETGNYEKASSLFINAEATVDNATKEAGQVNVGNVGGRLR